MSFGVFEVYFKQSNKNIIFTTIFATFYFEIAVKWSKLRILKNSNRNMAETPGKMHMYDMVKIDTIVFEIVVGGGGLLKPPGSLALWNSPDRKG